MTVQELLRYLPRGTEIDEVAWRRRHTFLLIVLALHLPPLFVLGLWLGHSLSTVLYAITPVALCVLVGAWLRQQRRAASFFVTAGLTYTAAAFVVLTGGLIEAHFHFFVIIGLIALYQDWIPFMWNIVFTVVSHGLGSAWSAGLIFNHLPAQNNPWLWSLIHGSAVVAACVGVVVFWRETEDAQQQTLLLTRQLAKAEIDQRKFTSDLLVNLARRNQSMLYRQLDIINQLEEKERDPDALGELFRLDHLATRIRRNAESLLVLSGEEPTRVWSEPVRLVDVVRAAIAETEDLERVSFAVDERMEVLGHIVTDLTHVLAELTENAVRFSPPEANVTIRTRPYLRMPGAAVLTVEDWGVGMRAEDMAAANDLLARPRDVDLSVSQRLGLHVVARLAARHTIQVSLTPTPGTGVTAVVVLPAELFAANPQEIPPEKFAVVAAAGARPTGAAVDTSAAPSVPGGSPRHTAEDPDIPMPRRTTPGSRPGGNGSRGLHARPEHEDIFPERYDDRHHDDRHHDRYDDADTQEWTGWWTPVRPPSERIADYPPPPIYATAEPVLPTVTTPTPPGHFAAAPALPAGSGRPVRMAEPPGPTVIARDSVSPHAPQRGDVAAPDTEPTVLLNRRVPQAHLAPELRRSAAVVEPPVHPSSPPPAPDAELARDALSRFQASRQAAQEQVGADPGGYYYLAEPETRQQNGTGHGS